MRIETANIPHFENKKIELPDPEFLSYKPDFKVLQEAWKEYGWYKNILVIGNGGSITSFAGFWGALHKPDKNIRFLSTVDPDYIFQLKQELKKNETLVIAISKSGETVTQIEALAHFLDYPLIFICGAGTPLENLGKKVGAKIYEHPPIGGRYTAFTEVGLLPAAIVGLPVEELFAGASKTYKEYKFENLASKVAQIMYQLEQRGYVDVFIPFYSHSLFGFSSLIVQLANESFGKKEVGQTYFAHEAPESQHHTSQRFFGGRKNISGLFVTQENFKHDQKTLIPVGSQSLKIKSGSFYELNNIPLSFAMRAEFEGTWEDAKEQGIPSVALHVISADPFEVGSFAAFWQLFAVYSSLLREVDPFDQPQVENSKKISWNKRLAFRR